MVIISSQEGMPAVCEKNDVCFISCTKLDTFLFVSLLIFLVFQSSVYILPAHNKEGNDSFVHLGFTENPLSWSPE